MAEPGNNDLDLIDPTLLPPQMRELVRLIGIPETLKLLQARGGLPTYIGKDPARSQLCKVISEHAIRALSEVYGDTTLDLPKADKMIAQLRNLYIVRVRESGEKSGRQLAAELGLTWRMIKYISAKARQPENPTADLFELDSVTAAGKDV